MRLPQQPARAAAAFLMLALAAPSARAEDDPGEDLEPDQIVTWSYALTAGATYAQSTTTSHNLTLSADATRLSASDKFATHLRVLSGRADGKTSAALLNASARYDRDFQKRWFSFVQGDYLRDRPSNIAHRTSVGVGVGYRLDESARASWSVLGGFGYTADRFFTPLDIVGGPRLSYERAEALIGTEADYAITPTLSMRHRLVYYPNLTHGAAFRVTYEAGAKASMTKRLSLDMSLTWRHSTEPGRDKRPDELLVVTGVSLRLD